MNRHQRDKNRATASWLLLTLHACENCGEKGVVHWLCTRRLSLAAMVTGQDDSEGFWMCPKLNGADGRRLLDVTIGELTR